MTGRSVGLDYLQSPLGKLLGVLGMMLLVGMTVPSAHAARYAGVEVGPMLWQQTVDATGNYYSEVAGAPGRRVIIVVTGTFTYSRDGRQDAHYRWHLGKNDHHSPCEMHSSRGKNYAFVIDGRCQSPYSYDFNSHTYVYYWTVGRKGSIHFQINDNKFGDNRGGLHVRVFDRP